VAGERKGKKLRRCSKLKPMYAAQFARTAKNQQRRMRNHIRSHPNDASAKQKFAFVKNFGRADTHGLNCAGRRRARRLGIPA
jgi:hypothetical protein